MKYAPGEKVEARDRAYPRKPWRLAVIVRYRPEYVRYELTLPEGNLAYMRTRDIRPRREAEMPK